MSDRSLIPKEKNPLNTKRLFLILATVAIVVGLGFAIQTIVNNLGVDLNNSSQASGKPYEILSIPPDTAVAGEEYVYFLRIGQFDSQKIYVSVTSKPDWLDWDEKTNKFSGIPGVKSLGQNYVVVKLTDTEVAKEQAFTIFVEEGEIEVGGEVQGIFTRKTSEDELLASELCQDYYRELGPLGVISEHPECNGIYVTQTRIDNQSGDVLGTSNRVSTGLSDGGVGVAPILSSAQISEAEIFGIKLPNQLGVGVAAFLGVLIFGFILIIIWLITSSIKTSKVERVGAKFVFSNKKGLKGIFTGNKVDKDQQSFIKDDPKDDEPKIVVWD